MWTRTVALLGEIAGQIINDRKTLIISTHDERLFSLATKTVFIRDEKAKVEKA